MNELNKAEDERMSIRPEHSAPSEKLSDYGTVNRDGDFTPRKPMKQFNDALKKGEAVIDIPVLNQMLNSDEIAYNTAKESIKTDIKDLSQQAMQYASNDTSINVNKETAKLLNNIDMLNEAEQQVGYQPKTWMTFVNQNLQPMRETAKALSNSNDTVNITSNDFSIPVNEGTAKKYILNHMVEQLRDGSDFISKKTIEAYTKEREIDQLINYLEKGHDLADKMLKDESLSNELKQELDVFKRDCDDVLIRYLRFRDDALPRKQPMVDRIPVIIASIKNKADDHLRVVADTVKNTHDKMITYVQESSQKVKDKVSGFATKQKASILSMAITTASKFLQNISKVLDAVTSFDRKAKETLEKANNIIKREAAKVNDMKTR